MKGKKYSTTQGVGETLKSLGSDVAKGAIEEFKNITFGAFDQFLGTPKTEGDRTLEKPIKKEFPEKPIIRRQKEGILFRFTEYKEQFLIKERIQKLIEEIRKEAEVLKKTTSSITSELKEIEKAALENLPEKVGVYHVRFLEVILKLVKSLRTKASESKTWLEALLTRKKKRGSLFLALSKKKGTQYSLSEELKMARSVQ